MDRNATGIVLYVCILVIYIDCTCLLSLVTYDVSTGKTGDYGTVFKLAVIRCGSDHRKLLGRIYYL